jgi:hypothetical protein
MNKKYILSFDVAVKSLAVSFIQYDLDYKNNINLILDELKSLTIPPTFVAEQNSKSSTEANPKSSAKSSAKNSVETLKFINDCLEKIISIHENRIKVIFLDVVDLIPNQKVKEVGVVQKTALLKKYLNKVDELILLELKNFGTKNSGTKNFGTKNSGTESFTLLIEYQMAPNDSTRGISSQIIMHYIDNINCRNINNEPDIHIVGASLKNQIYLGHLTNDNPSLHINFIPNYSKLYDANKAHSKFVFADLLERLNIQKLASKIKKKNYSDIGDSVLMSIAWILNTNNLTQF